MLNIARWSRLCVLYEFLSGLYGYVATGLGVILSFAKDPAWSASWAGFVLDARDPSGLKSLRMRPEHSERSQIVTATDFRRIALALPEAVEASHFGKADFRVGGKIFATLALESEGYGVLLLTPEQQAGMLEDEPEMFSPVPKGWGRMGATRVCLKKVPRDILAAALRTAWQRRAPKYLLRPK